MCELAWIAINGSDRARTMTLRWGTKFRDKMSAVANQIQIEERNKTIPWWLMPWINNKSNIRMADNSSALPTISNHPFHRYQTETMVPISTMILMPEWTRWLWAIRIWQRCWMTDLKLSQLDKSRASSNRSSQALRMILTWWNSSKNHHRLQGALVAHTCRPWSQVDPTICTCRMIKITIHQLIS